ncbi:unnamed protein product [Lasius platythorax]|uniref:Endonuclease/exonuclease/phosphatase domain-containing protein n=1 Tax=Lasius platythorax TaxID=488582 RepID=A0AAV2NXI5_9HYME
MDLILGTWNTRSLYRSEALEELTREIQARRVNVLAVQETRWTGSGTKDTQTHSIFYSGGDKHELGVAFIVEKCTKENVLDFKAISKRICLLRLRTKFFNLSIINVHAETEDKDDLTKEDFYLKLEQVYDTAPSNDIKILIGDLNAKIGKELTHREIIGKHSLHNESNDNGYRVINFAASRNMIVASTRFPRRDIHKWTWRTPDGKHHNQIDHVLVDKRGASSILNVRSYRGTNYESDHYLVCARYRCRITRRQTKQPQLPKIFVEKLKQSQEERTRYQQALSELLLTRNNIRNPESSVEDGWQWIKGSILQAAASTVGNRPRNPRKDWFDEECIEAINRRDQCRKIHLSRETRAKKQEYADARRVAKRILKRKKRTFTNDIMRKAEQNFRENNPREAYNFFKKGFAPSTTLCKTRDGVIITNKERVMERWKQYFEELLNTNVTGQEITDPRLERERDEPETMEPPNIRDVARAIAN